MSSDRSERAVAWNPFVQVLWTYPRRLFSTPLSWLLFFGLVAAVAFIFAAVWQGRDKSSPLLLLFPLLGLYAPMVVHMKEQFADARASLMPGFRRVHAEAAAVVILLTVLLWPAAMSWLMGLRSIGLTALATLLFGAVLWLTLNPSGWAGLLVGGMSLVCFTPLLQGAFGQLISGRFEAQAWLLFALGAAITLSGFKRLVRINEESPGYAFGLCRSGNARDRMAGQPMEVGWPLPRRWRDRWEDRRMARLTHHARCAATSRWSRACRWQVGMPLGWSVLPMLVFLLLCAVLGYWTANGKKETVSFLVISYTSIFTAVAAWGPLWRRRTGSLSYETLLPVARRDYLKQVAMAVAIQQFWLWLWGAGIIVAWFWLFAPKQNVLLMGAGVLISALAQLWIFGMAAWLFRYRSPMLVLLGMIAAMYPLVIPMALYFGPSPQIVAIRPFLLAWIGLLALLGALLTWWAYRRWLVADLDG